MTADRQSATLADLVAMEQRLAELLHRLSAETEARLNGPPEESEPRRVCILSEEQLEGLLITHARTVLREYLGPITSIEETDEPDQEENPAH